MLSEHHIYHALGAQHQMLGCDRELFMLNLLICAALIFTSLNLIVTVISCAVGLFIFFLLQYMGKKDLLLRHVYIRQLRYHNYYLAQASIHTPTCKQYQR